MFDHFQGDASLFIEALQAGGSFDQAIIMIYQEPEIEEENQIIDIQLDISIDRQNDILDARDFDREHDRGE